jgi:hypothetical protein
VGAQPCFDKLSTGLDGAALKRAIEWVAQKAELLPLES